MKIAMGCDHGGFALKEQVLSNTSPMCWSSSIMAILDTIHLSPYLKSIFHARNVL